MSVKSVVLVGAAIFLVGCPKSAPKPAAAGRGALTLHAEWPAPVRCAYWTKYETDTALHVADTTGCNAAAAFQIAPNGQRELELPYFRDDGRSSTTEHAEGERVVSRSLRLRDPAGANVWQVDIPESAFPKDAACSDPGAADHASVDLNPWRIVVVSVSTKDGWGTLRPITTSQDDTLSLTVSPVSGEAFTPTLVKSSTHDGVWAALWCDARYKGLAELTLDVRGAYQLETDTFTLPERAGEIYAQLAYEVEPAKGAP